MTRWIDRVDQLLYDGEEVVEKVPIGAGGVVVTTHRVLSFTPEGDGPNYAYADLPNVVGLERTTTGDVRLLWIAVRAGGIGLVLAAAGWLIDLDGLLEGVSLDGAGTGELGLGGVLGGLRRLFALLAVLDEALLLLGGLALAAAAVVLGVYGRSRTTELVVAVAGGDDLRLPAPDEPVQGRLRQALFPDGVPDPEPESEGVVDFG